MGNFLVNETSPYLLQHAENPVNWYPWCKEAFDRAKEEDKPVFLSIGYSTCHWCHVMAHESFENEEIARILNDDFISIKVDKEERPDIDSIYMSVCQAFTGSGGWPTTIFMTADQKPFFAGTYFPKENKYGRVGLKNLLLQFRHKWKTDRELLLEAADSVVDFLTMEGKSSRDWGIEENLLQKAKEIYKRTFDPGRGGFGQAPKFPTPHNLLFLMQQYEKNEDKDALAMAEQTLQQLYRGGIFDHIGGGFCRYSTDDDFLVPHFEKMLYDNALLIMAYAVAFQLTGKTLYRDVAIKTVAYVLREMRGPEGGFYSAQDADSEGEEGKFYLFEPEEMTKILGKEKGKQFNAHFDITAKGNFEGKNIPNLLKTPLDELELCFDESLPLIYDYRRNRYQLHLDDKVLTAWNSLMIAGMCSLYRITGEEDYLKAAVDGAGFIEEKLWLGNTVHISYRLGKVRGIGILDDYAFLIFAYLHLYEGTLDKKYLEKAQQLCNTVLENNWDEEKGGFFLYGKENEKLILRPKDSYDGAVFSGNSAMAYNLVKLYHITGDEKYLQMVEAQLTFLCGEAKQYPAGYAMFLMALSDYLEEPVKVTVAVDKQDDLDGIPRQIPLGTVVTAAVADENYPTIQGNPTYYVCKEKSCQPPVTELQL